MATPLSGMTSSAKFSCTPPDGQISRGLYDSSLPPLRPMPQFSRSWLLTLDLRFVFPPRQRYLPRLIWPRILQPAHRRRSRNRIRVGSSPHPFGVPELRLSDRPRGTRRMVTGSVLHLGYDNDVVRCLHSTRTYLDSIPCW